jgi:RNA polymerase sigma factor (TIGR02999 family)
MRRILVDNARRKKSAKHGGQLSRSDMTEAAIVCPMPSDELVALDEALDRLGREAPLQAELVKLRFFAGLSIDQAAEALGISRGTAIRHWSFARAWLYHQVRQDE